MLVTHIWEYLTRTQRWFIWWVYAICFFFSSVFMCDNRYFKRKRIVWVKINRETGQIYLYNLLQQVNIMNSNLLSTGCSIMAILHAFLLKIVYCYMSVWPFQHSTAPALIVCNFLSLSLTISRFHFQYCCLLLCAVAVVILLLIYFFFTYFFYPFVWTVQRNTVMRSNA